MASSANPAKPISSYQERLITLQVGNRRYCVPYEPLCAISTVFLDHPQAFSQGTYEAGWDGRLLETVTRLCHVDVDGELFKHVIDLACHKKYPLFYEEKTGFDVGRHARNSKSLRAHYVSQHASNGSRPKLSRRSSKLSMSSRRCPSSI